MGPEDCDPAGECTTPTCLDGVCGTDNRPDGTVLAAQTAGDCLVRVCDDGLAVEVNDAEDPQSDGNECTLDACSGGTTTHEPAPEGSPCTDGGAVCDGEGACVECVTPETCDGEDTACQTRTCEGNRCGFDFRPAGTPIADQNPGDCHEIRCDGTGIEVSVIDDRDLPTDTNECTDGVCIDGDPSQEPTPAGELCSLPDGGLCDGAANCVQCLVDSDCPTEICRDFVCQEPTCSDGILNGDEEGVDCGGTFCLPCTTLGILSVSHEVIAHGGALVLTGFGFTGATSVTVGGVEQAFTVGSGTQITIAALSDGTPIGEQPIVVTAPDATSQAYDATVIRLQINELDADTAGTDVQEFIEISTGVPGVSLADYTLVFFNGSVDTSYQAFALNATTDANGLLLVGNAGVSPAITFTNNVLQNGQDAVAVYQSAATAFPLGTLPTASHLIDALVYGRTTDPDDVELLDALISSDPAAPARLQVDEGTATEPSSAQSILRCRDGRRDGRRFVSGAPTPGAANGVTCP